MKPKVYIETTFISYLTARPSRDLIIAAHQQITHEWWDMRRSTFDIFISQLVIQEAMAGDKEAAKRRMKALEGIPLLEINDEVIALSHDLMAERLFP